MPRDFFLLIIGGVFCFITVGRDCLFVGSQALAATPLFSEGVADVPALPLASFLFAYREPMRVGWLPSGNSGGGGSQAGNLFVQLRPRRNEGEYRLALRVLRDAAHQFYRVRQLAGGATRSGHSGLDHRRYLTFPFELLIGAIQGAALRSLFPHDRAESGGWQHQVTYNWETPGLLAGAFTKSGTLPLAQARFKQGEKFILAWDDLRDDLELEPIAVRPPLELRKDESGRRYAFYRIQSGDTLYSAVVSRFMGKIKHTARSQSVGDLLTLNDIADAHQLLPGDKIKIPLEWLSPEYLHPVPSIYRIPNNSNLHPKDSPSEQQSSPLKHLQPAIKTG